MPELYKIIIFEWEIHTGGKSKVYISLCPRRRKSLIMRRVHVLKNGVTSHATFVCWLDFAYRLLLLLALAFVLFYEAINGFHDTANAVATVIYTRAMRSQLAVVMAAVFNFLGVLLGGLSVAYAIVHMLPTDLLLNMGIVLMALPWCSLCCWRRLSGTWVPVTLVLPASSSHTLIGAIIGIGLTNALMTGTSVVDALNIPESIKYFRFSDRFPYYCRPGVCWRSDFLAASLLERHQETRPYPPDPSGA